MENNTLVSRFHHVYGHDTVPWEFSPSLARLNVQVDIIARQGDCQAMKTKHQYTQHEIPVGLPQVTMGLNQLHSTSNLAKTLSKYVRQH